jgi:hypothetical protein
MGAWGIVHVSVLGQGILAAAGSRFWGNVRLLLCSHFQHAQCSHAHAVMCAARAAACMQALVIVLSGAWLY